MNVIQMRCAQTLKDLMSADVSKALRVMDETAQVNCQNLVAAF